MILFINHKIAVCHYRTDWFTNYFHRKPFCLSFDFYISNSVGLNYVFILYGIRLKPEYKLLDEFGSSPLQPSEFWVQKKLSIRLGEVPDQIRKPKKELQNCSDYLFSLCSVILLHLGQYFLIFMRSGCFFLFRVPI